MSQKQNVCTSSTALFLPFILIVQVIILSGCRLETSIKDLAPEVAAPATLDKATAQGFAPTGGQYSRSTVRNYLVITGAGQPEGEVALKSTSGYRVYSSVQGVVISTSVSNQ